MTIPNLDNLVTKLQDQLAALGDGRDARSDNERATYRRDYDAMQRVISGLRNLPDDLAKPTARLAELEARRAAIVAKEDEITKAVAEAPDPAAIHDARECDKAHDHLQHLARQRQLLRDGTLLMAPGMAYERLADLDQRIAEHKQRLASLRAQLDGHVQTAKALLAEPVPG